MEVGDIVLGNKHGLYAAPVRRHRLFLKSAYRQYPTPDGYLACHSNITFYRSSGEFRDQSHRHSHARRGSVLWNRRLGSVNMYITGFIKIGVDIKPFGVRADIGYRGHCRLLHNVAQRPRKLNLTRTRHRYDFKLHYLAAYRGPGKTVDNSDLVLF